MGCDSSGWERNRTHVVEAMVFYASTYWNTWRTQKCQQDNVSIEEDSLVANDAHRRGDMVFEMSHMSEISKGSPATGGTFSDTNRG